MLLFILFLAQSSHCFPYPCFIWQEHDTEQGWKKTFSGQVCGCKIKNITENECFNFISKRILLLLRCMTKPVVMINNVLEAQSSCVRAFCTRKVHASSNEYNALLYIPSVIQLFCMVFFCRKACTILITCMC